MILDKVSVHSLLLRADFQSLFINELGWDYYKKEMNISIDDEHWNLQSVAHKRGMVAYVCRSHESNVLPDYRKRKLIEREVAKNALEHLIIFTSDDNQVQVWQWAKREGSKPVVCREHIFYGNQPGDSLMQKLNTISFSLSEEESLSLTDVTGRARNAFDTEHVTKRFYEQFQDKQKEFIRFIGGISEDKDREWYASVMLNRLMFLYFIQRKGFLDNDTQYLSSRLRSMREKFGENRFYSFYRYFLLKLFHDGLGNKNRTKEMEDLLGKVPYLNGGIFDVHELERPERYGDTIHIPDEAFKRVFEFFDAYDWHLDERPRHADNEINPDVIGYIFEKFVNQKQMGAFYTKEDITEYICKNTLVPYIVDTFVRAYLDQYKEPVETMETAIWGLLKNDPDRYIYKSVRHGINYCYRPKNDSLGFSLKKESDAVTWDVKKPPQCFDIPVAQGPSSDTCLGNNNYLSNALPAESSVEYFHRQKRYYMLKAKLASGEITNINDLVTYNLNILQFIQDAIENCTNPKLLQVIWRTITEMTVLDPTCGSGAFLFSALNILEGIYEACLNRMEEFIEDPNVKEEGINNYKDFEDILRLASTHPNRRYFVYKKIILNNLYGVDIMEEAVEICKLRLFLKLAAQVNPDYSVSNIGIEPLPDIDFNIRTGNTLVGYRTLDDVKKALRRRFNFEGNAERIENASASLELLFNDFRTSQIMDSRLEQGALKNRLTEGLVLLNSELNRYLATEFGIESSNNTAFSKWLKSYEPFNWFVEYYGILQNRGGFDVIVGNPPYVSRTKITNYSIKDYRTNNCPDIYAPCVERSIQLLQPKGHIGMILPISFQFSDEFRLLRDVCEEKLCSIWVSTFSRNPSALFSAGLGVRSSIIIGNSGKSNISHIETTRLNRWVEETRPYLFETLEYTNLSKELRSFGWPRLDNTGIARVFESLVSSGQRLDCGNPNGYHKLGFKSTALYYLSVFIEDPPSFNDNGKAIPQTKVGSIKFNDKNITIRACAIGLSKIALIWWMSTGDDFDVTAKGLGSTPIDPSLIHGDDAITLTRLSNELIKEMKKHVIYTRYAGKLMGNYDIKYLRPITDQVDKLLLSHYNLQKHWDDIELAYLHFMKMTGERPGTTRGSISEADEHG